MTFQPTVRDFNLSPETIDWIRHEMGWHTVRLTLPLPGRRSVFITFGVMRRRKAPQ